MQGLAIAFLIGICSLQLCPYLPSLYWLLPLWLSVIAIQVTRPELRRKAWLYACIAGFSWALLYTHWQFSWRLPSAWEGKTISLTGTIASLPEQRLENISFVFALPSKPWQKTARLRLNWHKPPVELRCGEVWQLAVRLKQPHGFANPGGFDFEGWLFQQGIAATGYVVSHHNNYLLKQAYYRYPINHIREAINTRITACLNGHGLTGAIAGLAVGVRDQINVEQWRVMQGTGTNHLWAIAGLHIGFFAGAVFWLVNRLWRWLPVLPLYLPTPQAAALSALAAGIFYSALAGFALPTQRAIIMLAVLLLSTLLRRYILPWTAWSVAMLLILIIEPLAVLAQSFWLSFGAVGVIIYGMSGRIAVAQKWRHWLHMQWVVFAGLLPLTLLFFQQISFTSFFANAIAIPWVGFSVLPLSVLGGLLSLLSVKCGCILLHYAIYLLNGLWQVLTWLASLHALQWQQVIYNPWILCTTVIAFLLLLAPRGWPSRWLVLVWLLPLLTWQPPRPQPHQLWFTLLDVGQGLATVIQTANHVLVYDTGAYFSPSFNAGSSVVVPYLQRHGVKRVDKLVISHADNDHSGGAAALLKAIPVGQLQTSAVERFARYHAQPCLMGQSWQWDGVTFRFLYPPLAHSEKTNDSSCVLQVSIGKQNLLLPGDIEKGSERYLLELMPAQLAANILVVPHHGSRTSSTAAFVQTVQPEYALFAVGYRNRYRLPNASIMQRYQEAGAHLLDSVHCGAIEFQLDGKHAIAKPACYRQQHRRYWYAQ